jgi:hypothetical protein
MRGMKHLPTIRGWRQLCDVAEDFGFLPFLERGVDEFSVFGLTNPLSQQSLVAMVARVREAFPDVPVRDIETLLTKV